MSMPAHFGEQASSEPGKHITDMKSYLDTTLSGDTQGSMLTICAHGQVLQSPADKGEKKRRITHTRRGWASATDIILWGACRQAPY